MIEFLQRMKIFSLFPFLFQVYTSGAFFFAISKIEPPYLTNT